MVKLQYHSGCRDRALRFRSGGLGGCITFIFSPTQQHSLTNTSNSIGATPTRTIVYTHTVTKRGPNLHFAPLHLHVEGRKKAKTTPFTAVCGISFPTYVSVKTAVQYRQYSRPEGVPVPRPATTVALPSVDFPATDTSRLATPCTPATPAPPLSAAAAAPEFEALEGLGGDEPRINGLRFLNEEGATAATAGVGGTLAIFLLAGRALRSPARASAARAAAFEEAALIRAAAAADADSFVRGGLTDSR